MKEVIKEMAHFAISKEGIRHMRDASAITVAGGISGICLRNLLYKRSKKHNGWYSRYIDRPSIQAWMKADDAATAVAAIFATALDTVLLLDNCGVIKLRSIEEESDDPSKDIEDCKDVILKHTDIDEAAMKLS